MEYNNTQVEQKIVYYIKRWDELSKWNHFGIYMLGSISILGGIFVSAFIGSDLIPQLTLKVISVVATVSVAILTSFDMVNNRNKYRAAWRILNGKYMLYQADAISIEELILWYEKAEQLIGNLHFSDKAIDLSNRKDQYRNLNE